MKKMERCGYRSPSAGTSGLKSIQLQKLLWPFSVRINCSSDLKSFANFLFSISTTIFSHSKGTFFSEGDDMFVISTNRWTFFCSSISNSKSSTFSCKRNKVKSVKSHSKFPNINSKQSLSSLIAKPFKFFSLIQQGSWLFVRENSNNKAVCNEMFDLFVDGTKIEISRTFSDWNVPLLRSEQYRNKIPYFYYTVIQF